MIIKKSRAAVAGMLDDLRKQGIKPVTNEHIESNKHTENTNVKPNNLEPFENINSTFASNNEIIEHINTKECILWKYKDRPESELGDLDELADDIKQHGQLQPGIVRPYKSNDNNIKYEIIVGERRWRACKLINKTFAATIKKVGDVNAAIYQSKENDNRKDLSDYAKGINYRALIDAGILTAKELEVKLNKSQSHIRNILSFSRVSKEILDAMQDVTKISARTAYEIARLQEKNDEYRKIIIELAPKLSKGVIGANKLQKLIEKKLLASSENANAAVEIKTPDGRHIFTWKKDTNGQKSIGFPKNIRELVDFDILERAIVTSILEQLKNKTKREENEMI